MDPPPAEAAAHDAALAKQAEAKVAELRQGKDGKAGSSDAADLLEVAVKARVRGQRSYAEQLYSAAERLLPPNSLSKLDSAVPRRRSRTDHDGAQDDARKHAAPAEGLGRCLGRR